VVCLVKPQFEAGREKVGKKGVVRDPAVHAEVIEKVLGLAQQNGFGVMGLDYSPIRGPEGNIEYLIDLVKGKKDSEGSVTDKLITEVVNSAHLSLGKTGEEA